jgi:hypothetical protein
LRLNYLETNARHLFRFDQTANAFLIRFREKTFRTARREALRRAIVIDALNDAVDPTVTEGLFNGVVIRNARPSAVLLVVNEPDLLFARMIFRQPGAPRCDS